MTIVSSKRLDFMINLNSTLVPLYFEAHFLIWLKVRLNLIHDILVPIFQTNFLDNLSVMIDNHADNHFVNHFINHSVVWFWSWGHLEWFIVFSNIYTVKILYEHVATFKFTRFFKVAACFICSIYIDAREMNRHQILRNKSGRNVLKVQSVKDFLIQFKNLLEWKTDFLKFYRIPKNNVNRTKIFHFICSSFFKSLIVC